MSRLKLIPESLQLDLKGKVIAIDGKTSRRSFDNDKKALHLVSAFVSETKIGYCMTKL